MPFSIESLSHGVTRIVLEGDLDVFTIERLGPKLLGVVRHCPTRVEVDLSRLHLVDTLGMQILAGFFASLARIHCRIILTETGNHPLRCFRAALIDAIRNESQVN